MKETAELFDVVGTTAETLAGLLPWPASIIARTVSLTARAAAAFAKQGKRPDLEIARLLSQDDLLQEVRDEFESFIRKNWPS